jgi:tetratricopeptide (TPR) repeat protein
LAAAYLNRGTLHYRERRYLEAASDLDQALQERADPCIVYYNWALVNLAQDDVPGARSRLEEALRHNLRQKDSWTFSIASRAGDRF